MGKYLEEAAIGSDINLGIPEAQISINLGSRPRIYHIPT
jgi:hypothetical protein